MSFQIDLALLSVTVALAIRFAVLAATMPLLDTQTVPPLWRFALAVCLGVSLAPSVEAQTATVVVTWTWPNLVAEVLRSLVVGAMLGFTVNLVFETVKFAGSIAGMQVGFSIVNAYDPMTNSQISVLSRIYHLLAVLLFFVSGSHLILIQAMYQSCLVVPPFVNPDAPAGAWYLASRFGDVFSLGLRIAAPVVLILLLVSSAMGVVVKTVPQLNILAVGFPVKIAVGLMVFGVSLVYFRDITLSLMSGLTDKLGEVLLALS
ncbi:hypothetical protein COW53_08910 [bacterium CG17_big_fil_post_rev_8_21_14_2_50_64_8]|nr:MAG: hypothetical protein COW53_08910 [bacterium CG17_big_fil_post_rev_8_21_14_2_50_64_8]PJA75302.1 MAG: hypothetical protein CO151_06740 [bacterium CG_4_9_14_3_um_filter_65_15]